MPVKTYIPQILVRADKNSQYSTCLDPIKFLVPSPELIGFTGPLPGRTQYNLANHWTMDKIVSNPNAISIQTNKPVQISFPAQSYLEYYSFLQKWLTGCGSCGGRSTRREYIINFSISNV